MDINDYLAESPEIGFSFYTHIQITIINNLGREIVDTLDITLEEENVIKGDMNSVYGKFWLWVIGCYEIIRTMSQAKVCFSSEFNESLAEFKKSISTIRVPFAKQEYKGKNKPIGSEASINSFDFRKRDIGYKINGDLIWARQLINEFSNLIKGMEQSDIKNNHYQSYSYKLLKRKNYSRLSLRDFSQPFFST